MDKRKNSKLEIKKTTIKEITPSVLENVRGGLPGDYACDSNATCTGTACKSSIPIMHN
jgi:hypothetical protein